MANDAQIRQVRASVEQRARSLVVTEVQDAIQPLRTFVNSNNLGGKAAAPGLTVTQAIDLIRDALVTERTNVKFDTVLTATLNAVNA